jgi:hypothetical protein
MKEGKRKSWMIGGVLVWAPIFGVLMSAPALAQAGPAVPSKLTDAEEEHAKDNLGESVTGTDGDDDYDGSMWGSYDSYADQDPDPDVVDADPHAGEKQFDGDHSMTGSLRVVDSRGFAKAWANASPVRASIDADCRAHANHTLGYHYDTGDAPNAGEPDGAEPDPDAFKYATAAAGMVRSYFVLEEDENGAAVPAQEARWFVKGAVGLPFGRLHILGDHAIELEGYVEAELNVEGTIQAIKGMMAGHTDHDGGHKLIDAGGWGDVVGGAIAELADKSPYAKGLVMVYKFLDFLSDEYGGAGGGAEIVVERESVSVPVNAQGNSTSFDVQTSCGAGGRARLEVEVRNSYPLDKTHGGGKLTMLAAVNYEVLLNAWPATVTPPQPPYGSESFNEMLTDIGVVDSSDVWFAIAGAMITEYFWLRHILWLLHDGTQPSPPMW